MASSLANLLRHLHDPQLVRIRFHLPETGAEFLWAEPLTGNAYRLVSIPCFTGGLAADDTIQAEWEEGHLTFRGLLGRGGHATYRLLLETNAAEPEFDKFRPAFEALGCRCDDSRWRWFVLDVPPATDTDTLHVLLEEGAAEGIWRFEQTCIGVASPKP